MTREQRIEGGSPILEVDSDGIGWIIFDDPERSVNVLTEGVMRTLMARIEEIHDRTEEGAVRGLVIRSRKKRGFVAGADVDRLGGIESPVEGAEASRLGQAIFLELEQLPIPTVAAIHGVCLGGGLEMALACQYRLASDSSKTRLGFPEVQLGILPAWGGTTRLPRLIGLRPALDLILTGKQIQGDRARRIGLVEEVLPAAGFDDSVREFVLERIERGPAPTGRKRRVLDRLLEDSRPGRRTILKAAKKRVLERTRGHYPAPLKIIEVIRKGYGRSVEKSMELEALAAGELLVSDVTKSLVHVFHLREGARKGRGVGEAKGREVTTVGVVGAGVMGGGIAQLAAYNDIRARIKDIEHEAVAKALRHARSLFDEAVNRKKLTSFEAKRKMDLVTGGIDYAGLQQAELVVEAVVERIEVKRSVFRELEREVPPECVLATNTSTLRVDDLAEGLDHPERLVGMHFFNPVHRMPLVEVVRGARTSDESVATVRALALRMGKVPVVVRDGPGFVVNRILAPYLNEAGHLLSEGASIEYVDQVALEFGMPMGPFRLIDEVGIDIVRHSGEVLRDAFGSRLDPAPSLVALADTGRLGAKGELGFYRYENGKDQGPDQGVYELLGASVPHERKEIDRRDVRGRLLLVMVNEAARLLDEGVAESAPDVDLAMIMGTGFPPFRGGLLRYADTIHPRNLLQRLEELREAKGASERFAPAPLLLRLAEEDREFYEVYPGR